MRVNRLLSLLFVAACGGAVQSSSPPPPPVPTDAQQFSSTLATYFCGALKNCCDDGKLAYDDSACVSQVSALYGTLATNANANVTYDSIAAQKCIADMQAREARCMDDTAQVPSCNRVFLGKLAPGAPCKSTEECAIDPDPNVESVAVCEGTCQLSRLVVPVGGACKRNGPTTDDCTNGLSCASSPTCPDFLPQGSTCLVGGSAPCAVGNQCSAGSCNPTTGCHGTCVASLPQGSSCKHDGDCNNGMSCFQDICIVLGISHFFDISRRSCSIGPLTNGLDDGSLIAK